ncbi:hypothetical protein SPBR_06346 [Sporothrix brasiliensis 5110]|uniref:ABC multidrug transporter n=1 Tax=Sporothrix brasiliensis 5110 TaxID=1398154 RepID=A0A0C2FD55_9PEZI|nr:uncharacterized protein SPBR_06346 [Sporothrix brasiliensis 5110]KIH89068.1 hypothetical protein SPBR_06346 [Sporothrix brasiliensis 5110]
MDPSLCGFAADTLFGPAVASCRREFDFTVLFEEAVLTIIPAGTFALLASAIVVIAYRHKSPALVRSGRLYPLKLCSIAALTAAQVAVLVFQARAPNKTTTSIPSAAVSLVVTSIFLPLVSHIEHFTSRRPSALLSIFLVLTSLFDSTRTRTSWLVARASGSTNGAEIGLAIALTATVAIRVVLLYLETKGKKALLILLRENEKVPAEILAGPISRTVFHWLNSLLLVGYRNALQATDFGPIDDRLLSVRLRPKFQCVRDQYVNKENKSAANVSTNRLIVLTFSSLGHLLAGPIIARLAVTAFSFTQPFLANAALTYLQSETDPNQPASRNYGYGLIGATALTYVGIAAATSWYWHQAYRCSIMIRGGLTGVVFDKLMKLPEGDDIESKATTLVVNDVERIMRACARGHEVWAGTIETGLATWLLYRQLGPSCLVMLGVAAIAGLASTQSVKRMGARQQQWLAATQKRLKSTKHMLDSLKGIKMTSQDDVAYGMLNKLRAAEIKDSAPFRWIIVISCFLSYCTMILSPPLILGVYVGVGTSGGGHQDFSISTIFTSLVIIALLSSPLVQLFQVLPSLGAAHGCFGRLNTFLQLKEKTDFRDFRNGHNGAFAEKRAISSADAPIVSLQDVSLAWNESDTPVLTNINLEVQKGSKIAIVGPVGSGKTLLLKGIIGEVYKTHGVLSLSPTTSLAYCSQKPWLENMSAKRNLMQYGSETFDSDFYREIASNCMLDDIIQLPTFTTIIYSTHDENIARLADEAYRIDESGHLSRFSLDIVADEGHGGEDEPSASLNIVEAGQPEVASNATNATPKPRFSENEEHTSEEEEPPRVAMAHKLLGDLTVFKAYFKSVGWVHSTVFLFGAISWAISFKFSDVWIQWWTDAVDSGDSSKPLGYWLGVYAGLGVLALFVLTAWLYHQQFNIVSRSGENLHGQLATTVFKAQFPVISQIDTGTTLNRFSQDLMLVDMQLPLDLFNTASEFFTALIQVALIASASSWPALGVVPAMLILLYAVQHFYLRTSKQLRLHELEAKAALVTKISETGAGDGLSTIRAHGPVWVDKTRNRFDDKMDRSQEPLYLLYAVQRWLQLVLNLSVAGLVVVVLGTSVALKSSSKSRISPGAVGVAFLNAVTFGETITQFVTAWTGLETSLGAIARISLFHRQTAIEEDVAAGGSQQLPAIQDPGVGTIRFENIWATYDDIITDDVDPVTAQDESGRPRQGQHWSLRGVTLDVRAGERVAICGKTGSGKSTMHLALLRMVNIPVGSVFVNGLRHTNMSLEKLRKSFYIISQDTPHLGFDTLRQWIDPHAAFSDEHLVQVLRECGVLDMVMNTPGGLTASKGGFKFSVGEEQLLSVARVILEVERREGAQGENRGGIVLLDEATSSVDKDTEEKMENLIKTRLVGKTLIAINHRLEAVMDYDRALVLDNGMVVDFGTPAELVQRCELFAGLKARSG